MLISPVLEDLLNAFRMFPGIGLKSAQRMAIHLLEKDRHQGQALAKSIDKAMGSLRACTQCRMLSEHSVCEICENPLRDRRLLCIVHRLMDVWSIEESGCFSGLYFVLGGFLSPLDGVDAEELGIPLLLQRLEAEAIDEIILATNTSIDGEMTAHFLKDLIGKERKITHLAKGIPTGGELEFLDAGTLSFAFSHRR